VGGGGGGKAAAGWGDGGGGAVGIKGMEKKIWKNEGRKIDREQRAVV
jgi:hypothetical protein